MTETVGDVDISVFEETFNSDREPCALNECDQPANWFLLCPEDRSAETVCSFHRLMILRWPKNITITFNETCGHAPRASDCIWTPYTA